MKDVVVWKQSKETLHHPQQNQCECNNVKIFIIIERKELLRFAQTLNSMYTVPSKAVNLDHVKWLLQDAGLSESDT